MRKKVTEGKDRPLPSIFLHKVQLPKPYLTNKDYIFVFCFFTVYEH